MEFSNQLTNQFFLNVLKGLSKFKLNDFNSNNTEGVRLLGGMEGVLLSYGKLKPGVLIEYDTIEYVVNYLIIKKTKTRKQTYPEKMVKMFEELRVELFETNE